MLIRFKSKDFERMLQEATTARRKVRLQSYLERIEQFEITKEEVKLYLHNSKGFLQTNSSNRGLYSDISDCMIDIDKLTKLKAITVDTYSPAYAHKWSREIEKMVLGSEATKSVFPILNEFTKLNSLSCNMRFSRGYKKLPENIAKQLEYFEVHILHDINMLEGLENLLELRLESMLHLDLTNMPTLNKVAKLTINSSELQDLAFLANMPNVSCVDLGRSNVGDLSYVKMLKSLTELSVSNANLWSVEPLRNTTIEALDIRNNMVEDISPLKATKLTYLDICNNPISDLSALENQTELELLHFKHTWVTDITPILELKSLTEISLDITNLNDKKQLTLLKSKPYINGTRYEDFIKENIADSPQVK